MAEILKKLIEIKPAAGVLTAAAAVPANKGWLVSTVVVNNGGGTDDTYRIAHAVAGAANADVQYIFGSTTGGHAVTANSAWGMTLGITADDTDVFRFRSELGAVVFQVYGKEVDQ